MAEFFTSGTTPEQTNTTRQLEVKILTALNGGAGGGTGSGGTSGTGSPQGVVTASPGTTYLQTDTGSFWAKQTGSGNTGWLELIA